MVFVTINLQQTERLMVFTAEIWILLHLHSGSWEHQNSKSKSRKKTSKSLESNPQMDFYITI